MVGRNCCCCRCYGDVETAGRVAFDATFERSFSVAAEYLRCSGHIVHREAKGAHEATRWRSDNSAVLSKGWIVTRRPPGGKDEGSREFGTVMGGVGRRECNKARNKV